MRKKILYTITIIFVIFSMFLSGCSNSKSTNYSSKKVLEMWTRENSAPLLEQVVKEYNRKQKEVVVKLKTFPAGNISDQLATALVSDSAPDLVSLDLVLSPYFSKMGAFKDLSKYYKNLPYKGKLNRSMLALGRVDEKQFALPLSADVSALVYNKKHFREVGLDPNQPPQTWDQLEASAKKLTTKKHYGYVYTGADAGGLMFTFMPYIWGNGGDVLNAQGTKSLIASSEAKEAVDFFNTLTHKDKVTPPGVNSYGWNQATDAFLSGKASMLVTGNFIVSQLNKDYPNLDYGVALIPKNKGKNHAAFSGGELVGITSTSKYEKEAWNFIKYALSEKVQVETYAKKGVIPVRSDLYNNIYFKKEPNYKVFAESLKVSHAPYTDKYNELYNPIVSGLQKTFNQKESSERALSEIEKNLNTILNNGF